MGKEIGKYRKIDNKTLTLFSPVELLQQEISTYNTYFSGLFLEKNILIGNILFLYLFYV